MQKSPSELLTALLLCLIRIYRNHFSCKLFHACRFLPTCSAYAMEAIQRHGPFLGSWRTLTRLLRCQPFARAGYDPVR